MATGSYTRWGQTLKWRLVATALVLLVTACSKITEENFSRIQEGMSETEVIAILCTPPTESNSVSILGVSGAAVRIACTAIGIGKLDGNDRHWGRVSSRLPGIEELDAQSNPGLFHSPRRVDAGVSWPA